MWSEGEKELDKGNAFTEGGDVFTYKECAFVDGGYTSKGSRGYTFKEAREVSSITGYVWMSSIFRIVELLIAVELGINGAERFDRHAEMLLSSIGV